MKKREDFQAVYRRGHSAADHNIVLYCMENGTDCNRLGISASKKYGNSVERHRFQRRIREIYRAEEKMLRHGRDFIVIARTGAAESDYHALARSFRKLALRLHAEKER